eukprot:430155_1
MELLPPTNQNKWSDQIIHKKFKNKSSGSLQHHVRLLASRMKNTNSTKYNSCLYWNNGHRCIKRRRLMNRYKHLSRYATNAITVDIDASDMYMSDDCYVICHTCAHLNDRHSTKCSGCKTILAQNTAIYSGDYRLTGININDLLKSKPRKPKQRRKKRKQKRPGISRNFEKYWNEMRQSYDECDRIASRRRRRKKHFKPNGAFNTNLKFQVVIRSCEKKYTYYWTSYGALLDKYDRRSLVFENEININPNVKIMLSYFAVKDGVRFAESSASNVISTNFAYATHSFLQKRKLLKTVHQKLRDPNIERIPNSIIKEFITKSTVNIDEYVTVKETTDDIEYRHSLSFGILISAHQSIEYDFLQNNAHMIGSHTEVLTDVPMKLKNFILSQCTVHIHDNDTNQNETYNFISPVENNIYLPIYSCPYASIYSANAYPKTFDMLKNYQLKQFVMRCIKSCVGNNTFNRDTMGTIQENLLFSECHEPYYNLLPLSFKLSRILTDFIPVRHIVKRILIPYVGYNVMHYVSMECDIVFDNEQEDVKYVTDQYFEELMSVRGPSHLRQCHVLEDNGKVYDKDIVLLSIDGHDYVDLSDSEEEYRSTTSDHSSYFFDLFGSGSGSDDW